MAEKGVEEQVLAMERLPPFSFFCHIFCIRRPGEKTDADSFVLTGILQKKHSDFSLCLNVTTVSDILLD